MTEPKRSETSQSEVGPSSETAAFPRLPLTMSNDLSNVMLGEFRLLRKLGSGGMADVYLADQTTLRRQVAVKILRAEFLTNEQYVKRFRHEAAAAGSLNHPNIVQVYMVGEQNGISYIAQEYVQGRTLKAYLKRKGPIDYKIALHILRQVASALQVASESGIVHRDIKPENILLNNKGDAKVADFGLAQLTLQGERVALTQTGMTMGTPLYMSPEQINGLPLDSRSDMYSFGIMAWHILVGRPPFTGDTAMAVAIKHLNDKAAPLDDYRTDIPPVFRDFVKRLIQKKKEDRPNDFGEVLADIKQMIRQVTGKSGSGAGANVVVSIPRRLTPVFTRPIRIKSGWLIAACVFVLAASAGIGWSLRVPDLHTIHSTGKPTVPEMRTAAGQLYYAETNPQDEAAWILVKEFPGVSNEVKGRAQTALALIYLRTNRRNLAETIFSDLAMDSKLRANGLAGQALVAQLKGQPGDAKKLVEQVDSMKVRLFPEIDDSYKDLHQQLNLPR